MYKTISFVVSEGVATLTLRRPGRLNALIPAMTDEANDALDRLDSERARVLLVTGEGRGFCSGADLQAGLAADAGEVLEQHYNPFCERLAALQVPIVSAVNGVAAGAGCSLALAGDFVLAARSAYFLLAFANIGLVPDVGATWLVTRLVGRARATEMMILGERVPAEAAEAWGLIYRAVDDEALMSEARTLALRLATGPTRAYSLIRNAIRASYDGTFSDTLALERSNQRLAGDSADFKEGVDAFLNKRKARFTGA
ncbi:MAG: 2-(1,2-epoxy-1,2-dihydrophenyl)acetyl-CoA isomerase [Rhodospirillales bacterium]|nr:2-(1,2-epoxy-1,2-dihydrophenyl)acetyl-CoA isomerase [Rhodospirillales bacterium]